MERLKGKIAIVTGAASSIGMGFASARRMAQEGAHVVMTDLNGAELERREAELRDEGLSASIALQDVTKEADWERVVGETVATHGKLDVLVNNAGICILTRIADMSLSEWDRQISVNLDSVFLGCRTAIRQMEKQGSGAIVNISSIAAFATGEESGAYSASKAGVNILTKTLALEVSRKNIRVNSVHPGMIRTELFNKSAAENPETVAVMERSIPARRVGDASEIAPIVAFLASDDASYCCGSSFTVDGGVTCL